MGNPYEIETQILCFFTRYFSWGFFLVSIYCGTVCVGLCVFFDNQQWLAGGYLMFSLDHIAWLWLCNTWTLLYERVHSIVSNIIFAQQMPPYFAFRLLFIWNSIDLAITNIYTYIYFIIMHSLRPNYFIFSKDAYIYKRNSIFFIFAHINVLIGQVLLSKKWMKYIVVVFFQY